MATIIAFAFNSLELEQLESALTVDNFTVLAISDVSNLMSALKDQTIDAMLIGDLADDNLIMAVRVIITSTLSLHSLPILMIGTYHEAEDIARMLNLGIDDYIHQKMDKSVVSARLRSHLRRIEMHEQKPEQLPIVLKVDDQELVLNGNLVHITQSEFNILLYLANHPQMWHSSSEIFKQLWHKTASERDDALIRNHIRNLRRRLAAYPELVDLIATRQGRGYLIGKSIKIQ